MFIKFGIKYLISIIEKSKRVQKYTFLYKRKITKEIEKK